MEFFSTKKEWEQHLKPKLVSTPVEEASWMKIDADGVYESTETLLNSHRQSGIPSSKKIPGVSGVNPVTWGCFRSREIVSTTIIESESFRAWAQEAFEMFTMWARCFPRMSEEHRFLQQLEKDVVLVSVVGQRYVGEEGGKLWKLLLES